MPVLQYAHLTYQKKYFYGNKALLEVETIENESFKPITDNSRISECLSKESKQKRTRAYVTCKTKGPGNSVAWRECKEAGSTTAPAIFISAIKNCAEEKGQAILWHGGSA